MTNMLRRDRAAKPRGKIDDLERQLHKYETDNLPILRNQVQRLRDALERMMIGGNHIATWRGDNWPAYGTDHAEALKAIGSGQSYDMWCCWNAIMCARDDVSDLIAIYPATPKPRATVIRSHRGV